MSHVSYNCNKYFIMSITVNIKFHRIRNKLYKNQKLKINILKKKKIEQLKKR